VPGVRPLRAITVIRGDDRPRTACAPSTSRPPRELPTQAARTTWWIDLASFDLPTGSTSALREVADRFEAEARQVPGMFRRCRSCARCSARHCVTTRC
jgi:hypothetical protein